MAPVLGTGTPPIQNGATIMGLVSWSPTGSIVGDGLLGAVFGAAIAPRDDWQRPAAVGATVTALAGVTGLVLTAVYTVLRR
jgi:hypothetical protein